jgi:hypothetical protein
LLPAAEITGVRNRPCRSGLTPRSVGALRKSVFT